MNFDENSILADVELRKHLPPISVTSFDWMHNILVSGIVSVEIHAFLDRCKEALGVRYSDLNAFVNADWRFPSSQRNHQAPSACSRPGPAREKGVRRKMRHKRSPPF